MVAEARGLCNKKQRYFTRGGGRDETHLYLTQTPIIGQEYTIDCLFSPSGEPIYIIPRKRVGVRDGKSIRGEVCYLKCLESHIRTIAAHIECVGAMNIQAFINKQQEPIFIEVNPRLGGGSALGFAASENWIGAMVDMFVYGKAITAKPIQYGLKMARSYQEFYF